MMSENELNQKIIELEREIVRLKEEKRKKHNFECKTKIWKFEHNGGRSNLSRETLFHGRRAMVFGGTDAETIEFMETTITEFRQIIDEFNKWKEENK